MLQLLYLPREVWSHVWRRYRPGERQSACFAPALEHAGHCHLIWQQMDEFFGVALLIEGDEAAALPGVVLGEAEQQRLRAAIVGYLDREA